MTNRQKKESQTVADGSKVKVNLPFSIGNMIKKATWFVWAHVGMVEWKTANLTKINAEPKRIGKDVDEVVERYGTRGNVRGYTYNDEMQGQVILQLAQIGLQFDESKSNNQFAYYTAAVTNSFVRIINI